MRCLDAEGEKEFDKSLVRFLLRTLGCREVGRAVKYALSSFGVILFTTESSGIGSIMSTSGLTRTGGEIAGEEGGGEGVLDDNVSEVSECDESDGEEKGERMPSSC